MVLAAVKWALSNRTIQKHLFPIQNGAVYCGSVLSCIKSLRHNLRLSNSTANNLP
uniref:Uncharacterized protein n=2 Tax=Canis lupus familiaris TaxID=9615 RepID=A0A8C0LWR0_CANLF